MDQVSFKGARSAARIDAHVGERIRRRRTLLGFTQEQLADALEISYQQIQKYENGANRVSAGRLLQIARRLDAPITYFFEGLEGAVDPAESANGVNRATMDLVRNFQAIADMGIRTSILQSIKSLAGNVETEAPMPRPTSEPSRPMMEQRSFAPPPNGHNGNGLGANGHNANGQSNGRHANGHGTNGHGTNGHGHNGHNFSARNGEGDGSAD